MSQPVAPHLYAQIRAYRDEVQDSLEPDTAEEARTVGIQLDMVRNSMRLFDLVLPAAGAIIFFWHHEAHTLPIAFWCLALVAVSLFNEFIFARERRHPDDSIAGTRARARRMTGQFLLHAMVWSSIAIWMWLPGTDHRLNHLFLEFVLANTLAAVATMTAFHAAICSGPMAILSGLLVLGPAFNDFSHNRVLVGLATIFVALMAGQAVLIHRRVGRMLRLECERARMIEGLRHAKDESDAARRQAEEASRAKSAFLANMSHELRTPLNAIIGFSDIIEHRALGGNTDKYVEYGGFIHQSGLRLLNLIDDILDLAKIEAGKKILSYAPIDVGGLIADTVGASVKRAQKNGLTVRFDLAPDLPPLRADMAALRQIIDNLVSNAIKFTPPPGTVAIGLSLNATRQLVLCVSDTGPGIAPDVMAHIFDPMGHAAPQVRSPNRGTGLGLAIVKGLVEMHGGTVALNSELGEGTTITVVFPASATMDARNRQVA